MKNIILLMALVVLSGCASIIQSGPDRIAVNSNPEGAKVYLDGTPVGVTPMVVQVARKSECIIELKKEGYETVKLDRDKVVAGWVFGNLVLGGGIGLAVDLIGSNQGKYSEDPMFFEFPEKSPPLTPIKKTTQLDR